MQSRLALITIFDSGALITMNAKSTATTADEVQSNVSDAISGAEEMLSQAAHSTGEKAAELRARALQQLKALRERLDDASQAALQRSKLAARATDEYVHDHPWRSILAAASVGVVIGLLISRR
jgi:ElaB/YqjD/DUF883 family membrane-anchored ribosome-binding protein